MNFDLKSDMMQSVTLHGSEARESERSGVFIDARVRHLSKSYYSCKLDDLSITGFRMISTCPYEPGTEFFIYLPNFSTMEAQVMWRRNDSYGCRFLRPIHVGVFEHIAAKFPLVVRH